MTIPEHPTSTDPAAPSRARRSLSLEHKLPLLMTAVLLVVLGASLVLTYRTLSASTEERARARLTEAVNQVAGTAEQSLRRRSRTLIEASRHSALHNAALTATRTSLREAREALLELVTPSDSGMPYALWDSAGAMLVTTADSARDRIVPRDIVRELTTSVWPTDRTSTFSSMYPENGRLHFWNAAPIVHAGRVVGLVTQKLRVSGAPDASETLRQLTGEEVTLYVRNARSNVWALAPGTPVEAPTTRDSSGAGVMYTRNGTRMLAIEATIPGTPWIFVLEEPLAAVRARPRVTITRLALLSIALVALGAALSLVISKRITRPLGTLTLAAEEIARGNYSRRLDVQGSDELARLGLSFNQMAAQIDRSRRELEERVADARRAREEAEAANRAKSDFLAVMSHELRTPLNAIAGYAQLMEMGIHGEVSDAQRDALARIKRSQAHLLSLINDVLSFAKIDAGQVEYDLKDVPLTDVLGELEALVAPQIRAKGQHFEMGGCDSGLAVQADRDKLRQILINLVSNAIKFTPEEGTIVVQCAASAEQVAIRVRDNGIGIPEERHRSIFEPFVQAGRALNRPDEGVGLGLAISRDLARGMGGDVVVESEPGAGSVFTVTLPRGATRPASVYPQSHRKRLHKGS